MIDRRNFLSSVAGASLVPFSVSGTKRPDFASGKVEHCIHIWLGGGACQIDTWDPKIKGDPKLNKPGSYYDSIETSVSGLRVCEHLKQCSGLMEHFTLLRTVHHETVDEHAAATNQMHTGRPVSGTIVYPSIGSVIAHEKGTLEGAVPGYVLMGYPNLTRGPGFLGAQHGFVYLTSTEHGPAGLARPKSISTARQSIRNQLLSETRKAFIARNPRDSVVRDYDSTIEKSQKMSGGSFMNAFDLGSESATLRNAYGGEFGQRCLLARRLIQRGVRFQEVSFNLNFVNGTGWDTHQEGQLKQHLIIQQLDQALATLVKDLQTHKLLEKTLIVVSTEFGRPPGFDSGGGRGHQSSAFTVVLAGGGLNHGKSIGVTDEIGKKIIERPVSVPDLFATIHWAMGINPSKNLYAGDRPVPITDLGNPVRELFI
ncbi:MAG TPA: DUF1501 domain-containing protein [Verrucomicrobiales bacterium]|nr:DUF1501 domain-containing protein [Verrucomicrobiales bacterium]